MSSVEADQAASTKPWIWIAAGVAVLIGLGVVFVSDRQFGWLDLGFDWVAHFFYEVPVISALRRPSQLALLRAHLWVFGILVSGGLILHAWLGKHARTCLVVFMIAYALRATLWIVGSNLPLVPGDSCHYIEVAASIWRGEGPVKHYVESFFADYPPIRQGKGVLDDWATPLYAYVLAFAYRLTGIDPTGNLEEVMAVAKGTSFVLNLACLPAIYGFARRRWNQDVALLAMALMAVLPVHALYAAFELRESLVALTTILAIWFLVEMGESSGKSRWIWAIAAGCAGGLSILARNTAMAVLAAGALYALLAYGRRVLLPLIVWGAFVVLVITPWALATQQAYGEPFYTYTKYFQYTFSWTVHHYQEGRPSAATFYTWANAPEILRVKIKALAIMVVTSSMILGLPLVIAALWKLVSPRRNRLDLLCLLLTLAFGAGTLANVADITQVGQLGRYFLPLFCLLLPSIAAAILEWSKLIAIPRSAARLLALSFVAIVWSDPTWSYDYTWMVKPYQLHWPALREAGDWVRLRPEVVPKDARIMTWFPWEMRLATQRTTVLLPRSYQAQRIDQVIRQYGVTHIVWGSFESPPNVEPEGWGRYLESTRVALGLNDREELFRSSAGLSFPVRIYRVRGSQR